MKMSKITLLNCIAFLMFYDKGGTSWQVAGTGKFSAVGVTRGSVGVWLGMKGFGIKQNISFFIVVFPCLSSCKVHCVSVISGTNQRRRNE